MLDQGPGPARPGLTRPRIVTRLDSGSGRESKLYVAVNSTLVLPWPMPTYSSLENIFKCVISQNSENLDPAEGVCMCVCVCVCTV